MGASGSGKTTLLNIIGCLDTLDNGSYHLAGESVKTADDDQLAQLRSQHIGFVFQSFNLIPRINAWRNVEIPMIYRNIPSAERRIRALAALERIGIGDRAEHLPAQLSGGQQQRVAIARALVNSPQVLVADEPTGSLDSHNGKEIMQLFQTLNAAGMTIVMVTHERDIADQAKRIITLHDGLIIA
jgi:ABC-type lipoprotein export system ATPase subunit